MIFYFWKVTYWLHLGWGGTDGLHKCIRYLRYSLEGLAPRASPYMARWGLITIRENEVKKKEKRKKTLPTP
jgi:hypothetical protein